MMRVAADKSESEPALGWLMVVMAAIGMVATLPGRTHGLGMITERLLADPRLGIDRVEFGRMNLWATLLGALFCLVCGPLVDRVGSRRVMTGIVLLLGLTVLGMCRATDGWMLFVLLVLTRGLGQSALSVVTLTLIGKWFRRKLPVAMGIFSVLVATGFMTAFGVCRGLHSWDWTRLWASLGWILVLIVAPLVWLVVRDGSATQEINQAGQGSSPAKTGERDWSLAEALATPAFWSFGLATSIYGLIAAGTSLFNESLLAENGFPPNAFYEVAIVGSFVGMAFNFLGGALCRGGHIKLLTAAALVVLYGQAHLGRIQGVAQMLTVLASALGPELMAQWKHRSGSYAGLLYLLAAVIIGLGLCVAFTPLPRRSAACPVPLHPEPQPAGE